MIENNFNLQSHHTLGVQVYANYALRITCLAELQAALQWAQAHQQPYLVLGGGSNIVFTKDYAGLVLLMQQQGRQYVGETATDWLLEAQAGENWHAFVAWTLAQGYAGLENLALIPGTVGAAPIQNIGAYGLEVAERIVAVEVWDCVSSRCVWLERSACCFGYRDSIFKQTAGRYIVLSVRFALPKAWQANTRYRDVAEYLSQQGVDQPTAQEIFAAVVAIRRAKLPDPQEMGNVGSFFKNPLVSVERYQALAQEHPELPHYPQPDGQIKLAAGWLIDRAGWKGRMQGRAGVHARQALVLVNLGGATGNEILELAQQIQRDVLNKFAVALEPEPLLL